MVKTDTTGRGHGQRSQRTHWSRTRSSLIIVVGALVFYGLPTSALASVKLRGFPPPTTSGSTLWTARFSGQNASEDYADAVKVSPDGTRVFVTGETGGTDSSGNFILVVETIAYDASTGKSLWKARYSGPIGAGYAGVGYDIPLAVSPDGSEVFVAAPVYANVSVSGMTQKLPVYGTIAYNAATGQRVWAKTFKSSGCAAQARKIAVSPDGTTVFVAGDAQTACGSSNYPYVTLAYNASTGAEKWLASYDGPGDQQDVPTGIIVSPDSSKVFVTGDVPSSGGTLNWTTVAYAASSGAKLWARVFDGTAHQDDSTWQGPGNPITITPDGSKVVVAGEGWYTTGGSGYQTIAYSSSTGTTVWSQRYLIQGGFATAIAASPDSSKVFVTGEVNGDYLDYMTFAYSAATGSMLWKHTFDGPLHGNDYAYGIGVSPDSSKVYVTGESENGQPPAVSGDWATLSYDAGTGHPLWRKTYAGPVNSWNFAYALCVGPTGSVYVTGNSTGKDGSYDYATIAYAG